MTFLPRFVPATEPPVQFREVGPDRGYLLTESCNDVHLHVCRCRTGDEDSCCCSVGTRRQNITGCTGVIFSRQSELQQRVLQQRRVLQQHVLLQHPALLQYTLLQLALSRKNNASTTSDILAAGSHATAARVLIPGSTSTHMKVNVVATFGQKISPIWAYFTKLHRRFRRRDEPGQERHAACVDETARIHYKLP